MRERDREVGLQEASLALSTMEAVFVASSLVVSEILGLRELLDEVGIKVIALMMMHVDNQAAIKRINGEDSSRRAIHIVLYDTSLLMITAKR